MNKFYLKYLLLFLSSGVCAQTSLQWHINSSGSSNGVLNQMFKFPNDDVLVKGYSYGGDLDPGAGVTVINSSCFFARYSTTGALVFARPLSYNATGTSSTTMAEMDSDGNFYMGFRGGGTFDLDPDPGVGLMAVTTQGPAFAKFNAMGVFQWGLVYNTDLMIYRIKILSDKSVIISGTLENGTHDLDPGTGVMNLTVSASEAGFIAKFDSSGNFVTAIKFDKSGGANAFFMLARMVLDQNDNIYIGGLFQGTFDVDPGTAPYLLSGTSQNPDPNDWFFIKLDQNLNFVYAHKFIGTTGYDIVVDNFNDVYLLGSYKNTVDVDLSPGVVNITTPVNHESEFLAKYDGAANLKWVKTITPSNGSYGFTPYFAYFDEQGLLNFDATLYDSILSNSFGFPQLPANGFTSPGTYMIQIDTSGTCVSMMRVADNTSPKTLAAGPNNFYFSGRVYDAMDIQIGPGVTINTPTGANEFFLSYYSRDLMLNRIDGIAFLDINGNGTKDTGENGLHNLVVEISPGGYFISTDNLGRFSAYIPTDSYTISIPSSPGYVSGPVPNFHTANFSTAYQLDTANNFAFTLNTNEMDMAVYLTAQGLARPGMNYNYNLTFSNQGNNVQSGVIELVIDSAISVVSASPLPAFVNGTHLQWNYSGLNPLQSNNISLTVQPDTTSMFGDSIITTVSVTSNSGDFNPGNNADTSVMIVLSSYDPNSKEVQPTGALAESQVVAGIDLTYIIRFQNTGNDTAFFVSILDTLSSQLDIGTLRIVDASHPYVFNLYNGNLMEFRFSNIQLPDSNINEPGSHGFIRYTIKPLPILIPGDIIENTAYIYFDFNQSVQTNTTHTPIVDFIGLPESGSDKFINVYPNPFNEQLQLIIKDNDNSVRQIFIRDITGREISSIHSNENSISLETSQLTSGMYIIEVRNIKGSSFLKVCKNMR